MAPVRVEQATSALVTSIEPAAAAAGPPLTTTMLRGMAVTAMQLTKVPNLRGGEILKFPGSFSQEPHLPPKEAPQFGDPPPPRTVRLFAGACSAPNRGGLQDRAGQWCTCGLG